MFLNVQPRITASSHPRVGSVNRLSAFTLVETVLAIGIVSFAMISILGLVPVGLGTFRKAMNLTVESAIVQSVAGELQRIDYSNEIQRTDPLYFYFDDQGVRIPNSGSSFLLYTVQVPPSAPLEATNLVNKSAAVTALIRVSNKARPDLTNRYSVIIPHSH